MTHHPAPRLWPRLLFLLGTCALLIACMAPQPGDPPPPSPMDYLKVVAAEVMRVEGNQALRDHAPEMIPVLDVAPADGDVTIEEIQSFLRGVVAMGQDPSALPWLGLMVRAMIRSGR